MNPTEQHQIDASTLATIDSQLEQLSLAARNGETMTKPFFHSVHTALDALLAPAGVGIVATNPAGDWLLIQGSHNAAEQIGDWISVTKDPKAAFAENALQPKSSQTLVRPIERNENQFGFLIVHSPTKHLTVAASLVTAIAEILGEFVTAQTNLRNSASAQRMLQFSHNVHSSLNPKKIAQHIADDGRVLLGCERVSVYENTPSRMKLLAVSAIADLERRSEVLKLQSKLVIAVARKNQPIGTDQPPEQTRLNNLLETYTSVSGFPFVFGMPLKAGSQSVGYLLAEAGSEIDRLAFAQGLQIVIPSATLALKNGLDHSSIPWRGLGRWLSPSRSTVFRCLAALSLCALTIAALIFVKTDFKIRVHGELRPIKRQYIFAPRDGVVERVLIKARDDVRQQQTLLEMRSPELELSIAKNISETERLKTLLDAKKVAINQAASDSNVAAAILGQLSSDVSELEYQLKSLADELIFLQQQQSELKITSPLAGKVVTPDVARELLQKPVRWGDALLQIADEAGAWELRFSVPERQLGYVLAANHAFQSDQQPQSVVFFFEAEPAKRFTSKIESIGNSTTMNEQLGPVGLIVAPATAGDYTNRHGARVIADINCGRRSLGYVWLHQWIDSVRRRFVF